VGSTGVGYTGSSGSGSSNNAKSIIFAMIFGGG
jgi:hypothetical protein